MTERINEEKARTPWTDAKRERLDTLLEELISKLREATDLAREAYAEYERLGANIATLRRAKEILEQGQVATEMEPPS